MEDLDWIYLRNPFDNVTKRNHKRMYLLATDHFDKLKKAASTNPEIQRLYDFGLPYFEAFREEYLSGTRDNDTYRKYTKRVEVLLKKLSSTLIRRWDSFILFHFDTGTPEYQELMPDTRFAFRNTAYDERIKAVENLLEKLKNYPTLAPIQGEVAQFHGEITQARTQQQGMEYASKRNAGEQEEKRFALAQAMRGILGGLAFLFFDRMWEVKSFYELKYLRTTKK